MPAILARLAPQFGAEITLEPEFRIVGRIRFPNGRQSYFWHNKFNLNSVSAARIAQDKGYATFFLETLGFRVPRTRTFFREDFRRHLGSERGLTAAYRYACDLGWPVYLKPCRRSQGDGVALASKRSEFYAAARVIFHRDRMLLVQERCCGRDYRLVVLDGEVISAYERIPLTVTGNNRSTIAELLTDKQRAFDAEGRDTCIPVDDPRLNIALRQQRLGIKSVLPSGREVRLLDVANLSCGGTSVDITEQLHSDAIILAGQIASALDLRFAGVDLITTDITRSLGNYVVIEVNSTPGLDHYASSGPEHEARIDALYRRVLEAIARGPR